MVLIYVRFTYERINRHSDVLLFPRRVSAFRIVNTPVIIRRTSGSYSVFIYLYSSPLKCIFRD